MSQSMHRRKGRLEEHDDGLRKREYKDNSPGSLAKPRCGRSCAIICACCSAVAICPQAVCLGSSSCFHCETEVDVVGGTGNVVSGDVAMGRWLHQQCLQRKAVRQQAASSGRGGRMVGGRRSEIARGIPKTRLGTR